LGADNQAKNRQKNHNLRRKVASRKSADRLLIVCEGTKTEPLYLDEIRKEKRLPTTDVYVVGSNDGSDPLSVVHHAKKLFVYGDPHRAIRPRIFDQILVVFDRDNHTTFYEALKITKENHLQMKNDLGERVPFEAIVSIPCFEFWLLLHFEELFEPLSRFEVYKKLKNYLPHYEKGAGGLWTMTKSKIDIASSRAAKLVKDNIPNHDSNLYTNMHSLVERMLNLRNQRLR
jgi:RloB-like protein